MCCAHVCVSVRKCSLWQICMHIVVGVVCYRRCVCQEVLWLIVSGKCGKLVLQVLCVAGTCCRKCLWQVHVAEDVCGRYMLQKMLCVAGTSWRYWLATLETQKWICLHGSTRLSTSPHRPVLQDMRFRSCSLTPIKPLRYRSVSLWPSSNGAWFVCVCISFSFSPLSISHTLTFW